MPEEAQATDLVDEFFAEGADAAPENGGLADGFLNEVLADEPETPAEEEAEKEVTSEESDKDTEELSEESDKETSDKDEPEDEEPSDKDKPEEDEDDVPEELPKGTSKKASEDWKKLRGSRDKYKTQTTELENAVKERETKIAEFEAKVAELEELRGKAAVSAELEEKLKNFEEMEKTVSLLRVEESSEYKKAVTEPLDAIADQVDALAKSNEATPSDLYAALNETDLAKQRTMLKEATAGWDEIEKVELWEMAKDARSIFAKQREMRENAHEARKQQEAATEAETAKQAEARKREFVEASKGVVDQIKDKVPFVPLRDGETVEDRFAAVAEKLKGVDFDANSTNDKAFAAASALVLPSAVKTITKLQAEVEALEKRLAKTNSSKPSKSDPVDDGGEDEEDFFEAVGIKTLDASQRLKATG